MDLPYSPNNTVVENNIANNSLGLVIQEWNNTIYHNNFLNNTEHAFMGPASYCNNTWDNGYPSGGNYWDNYTGNDLYQGSSQDELGSDGIGDTAYVINENNVDRYPLMNPYVKGDMNHDAIVDILDAVILSNAFGSTPESSKWNSACDLYEDGAIDIFDAIILANHFDESWV